MDAISAIALLAVGASLGSFLNVVALRYISHKDIVKKPSHCPHCHRSLEWFELIPLVSFILLRGRCRSCRQPISIQYPVIEMLAAISALIIFSPLPAGSAAMLSAVLSLAAVCLLLVLAAIDSRTMILPDMFIGMLTGVIVLQLAASGMFSASRIVGAAAGAGFLLLLWLLTKRQGIGLGDIKIAVPLGLLVGWPGIISLLLLAFMSGGLWGIYLLALKGATRKTAVPFGPFLVGAAIMCIWWPSAPASILSALLWP